MNLTVKTDRLLSLSGMRTLTACALLLFLVANALSQTHGRRLQNPTSGEPVSRILWLQIVRAEDERRWDNDLSDLLKARNANVRARAALAAGRIGDEQAVAGLIPLLQRDDEPEVRAMAAFALGEIESPLGADALVAVLRDTHDSSLRSRAVEALGKITAALPKEQATRAHDLGAVVLEALNFEARRRSAPDTLTMLLGLTAVLRAKPDNTGPVVTEFLHYSDPRIRADAANTLARLKLKDGNDELRKLLLSDPDAVVRANAARVLGATEDKSAYTDLLDRALKDQDARVRVSAIRALATLKDARATSPLLERGITLLATATSARKKSSSAGLPAEANELLEIASTLGRMRQDSSDERVTNWLRNVRPVTGPAAPEVEIAFARVHPAAYLNQFGEGPLTKRMVQETLLLNWRAASSIAQGLGEISASQSKSQKAQAEDLLRAMLDYRNSGININTLVVVHSEYAIPDVLQAFAAFKTNDLAELARKHLGESDVVIRATAAELLGGLPPDETNARALIAALPPALADAHLNDAALAILDALGKQKSAKANEAVKTALNSNDHLIRRKAVAVLKANGAGDFSSRIGIVGTRNAAADYERAFARIGKRFSAIVTTTKGNFTIELLPEEAPMTVDNFIQLAKRRYFNGITIHRVVPNFVIQDGDPRGDGNGGPGYQIRCEINEATYKRGAVGMALSGKDTGGSQWFVTHSPQPHLDGGYTVFGNVVTGMDVVDNIVRGDVIRSVAITETTPRGFGRR
ncbi:MAG TPA: peptidylprolyl isomerase [Pyrinomonadaceae bacterium]|nr:peptidylprolyl isomerase [Pyrinomonadaceae bacterium]